MRGEPAASRRARPSRPARWRCATGASRAAAGALVIVAAALARAGGAAEADPTGVYRLHGTAQVAAGPALDRTVEVHADALVGRGDSPQALVLTLGAEGARCRLAARVEVGGALTLPPGQQCRLDLASPDARGRLGVELRAGGGRLADDALALELSARIDGEVSLRAGGTVDVLGRQVDVPSGWTPPVPVHGEARARAQGGRDHSRAAHGAR